MSVCLPGSSLCQAVTLLRYSIWAFFPLINWEEQTTKVPSQDLPTPNSSLCFGKGIKSRARDCQNSSTTRIFVPNSQFGLWQHLAEVVPVGKSPMAVGEEPAGTSRDKEIVPHCTPHLQALGWDRHTQLSQC